MKQNMAKSSSSSSLVISLLTVTIVIASLSRSVEASKGFDLSWAMMTSLTDHEFDMESDISRRFLVDSGGGAANAAKNPKFAPCTIEGKPYAYCKLDGGIYKPCVGITKCT